MYRTTFTVSGTGTFPLDMLRYDGCYPARSDDVNALLISYRDKGYNEVRYVTLVSHHARKDQAFTEARWRSFTWSIVHHGMLSPLTEKVR